MSKKKPTQKHTLRISEEDRLHAVLLHPQFIQDYQHIQELKAKAHTKNELQRLDTEINRIERKWGGPFLEFMLREIQDIKYNKFKVLLDPVLVIVIPPLSYTSPRHKYSPRTGMLDSNSLLKATRYLALEIDLWRSKDRLMKEVKRLIGLYHRPLRGRIRATTCDPWKIYIMHHYEKKSLLKIAKEIYGFKDNPTYNEKAKAKYKQVTRAYKKACKMIQDVTPIT